MYVELRTVEEETAWVPFRGHLHTACYHNNSLFSKTFLSAFLKNSKAFVVQQFIIATKFEYCRTKIDSIIFCENVSWIAKESFIQFHGWFCMTSSLFFQKVPIIMCVSDSSHRLLMLTRHNSGIGCSGNDLSAFVLRSMQFILWLVHSVYIISKPTRKILFFAMYV